MCLLCVLILVLNLLTCEFVQRIHDLQHEIDEAKEEIQRIEGTRIITSLSTRRISKTLHGKNSSTSCCGAGVNIQPDCPHSRLQTSPLAKFCRIACVNDASRDMTFTSK